MSAETDRAVDKSAAALRRELLQDFVEQNRYVHLGVEVAPLPDLPVLPVRSERAANLRT
jgi:hypothetical protein